MSTHEALAVVEEDDQWWLVLLRDLETGEPETVRVALESALEVMAGLRTGLQVPVSVNERQLLGGMK